MSEIEFEPSNGQQESQQPAAPTSPAASPTQENSNITVGAEFSSSQLTQMAQWEVDAGRLTREEANKMLSADGAPLLKAPIDPNSPEAYVDSIMPPAEAKQFSMPPMEFEGDPSGREAQAVDKIARGWLSEARFTREIGNFVAEEVSRTAAKVEKMSEFERRAYKNEQANILQKVFKGQFEHKLNLAKSLVNHLEKKQPGLKAMLEATGAGDNAMVISKFAMQAELLLERQRK